MLARVEAVPALRFFSEAEAQTLGAFCDVVLAQDAEPRIPVLAFVDQKLAEGRLDGFRYDGMPDDRETWRLVARGLDEAAGARGAASLRRGDGRAPERADGRVRGGRALGRSLGAAAAVPAPGAS